MSLNSNKLKLTLKIEFRLKNWVPKHLYLASPLNINEKMNIL